MKIREELKRLPKTVLDHFTNPRNVGTIPDADITIYTTNPDCNDIINFYFRIDNKVISNIKIKVFGCSVSIASASIMSSLILHQNVLDVVRENGREFIQKLLKKLEGIPPDRLKCSVASQRILVQLKEQISCKEKAKK